MEAPIELTTGRVWASKAEAAAHARCHPSTIDRYIAAGRLTLAGHDKKILVDLMELDQILLSKLPNRDPWGDN